MEWGILGLIALIIGIAAGIVQVLDYLEKRRRKREELPTPPPLQPEIPHNLPQPGEFIGRQKEKAEVREALASRSFLVSIDGIGGIGKTALALEVACECLKASKDEIPADGIPTFGAFIWTTAKDRELAMSDILDTLARTLDYPYIAQLPPEEKPSEAAKLLQAQKCLLIVDNFETITDDTVRDFLLSLPDSSKALVTSREQKLRQARAISLRGMEKDEALILIRSEGKRLGLPTVERAEEKALLRLYEATGGAPLAIKWAVGQMKQRGQSLDTVLDYLYEARGDVFENIFARSWELLSENARRVLMVMPIFATSASKPAIEAASDVHKWDLDEALGQLVEMWLVEASAALDEAKRRYSVHPLTRAYARSRLTQDAESEEGARLQAAKYLLEYARKYGGFRRWETYDELEQERKNLLVAAKWCYEKGSNRDEAGRKLWQMIPEFARAMADFLRVRRYWDERLELSQHAAEICETFGDWYNLGWRALDTGWGYRKRGELSKADPWVNKGIAAMERSGDIRSLALSKRFLGLIARDKGDYERARQILTEVLHALQESGKKDDIALVAISLGNLARMETKYTTAASWYERALEVAEDLELRGWALRGLADITLNSTKWAEAQQLLTEGLVISQKVGRVDQIASFKAGLAKTLEMLEDYRQAQTLAQEALVVYQRLGMREEVLETRALVERLEARIAEARK
jgi:tetratricopeptide (TPR) repeat protein